MTRHGISSPDARTTTPRRSRRDPRRAIRGLQGAAQGYCRGCADEAAWLSDTVGLPIGAVDRNGGLTRCRRWRTCWTGFRRGGTTCPPAWQTARQRKRSTPYWSCAVMLKIFRRSSCQKASDGTDGAHQWHCETRFLCVQRIHPASRGHRSEALRQSKGTGLAASGPWSSAGGMALRRMIRSASARVVTGWVASRSSL